MKYLLGVWVMVWTIFGSVVAVELQSIQILEPYIEKINALSESRKDSVVIELMARAYWSDTPRLVELIRYVIEHIVIKGIQGEEETIELDIYDRYVSPSRLLYEYEFYTYDKPRVNNSNDIIITWPKWRGSSWDIWRRSVWSRSWTTSARVPVVIKWETRSDIEYIEVVRDGDKESYFLKDYQPWSKKFEYIISNTNKNIAPWTNWYLIRAYAKDRFYQVEFVLEYIVPWVQSSAALRNIDTSNRTETKKSTELRDECYSITNNDQERSVCVDRVTSKYMLSKSQACVLDDGEYSFHLETNRPWKKSLTRSFSKLWNTLVYPVSTIDVDALESQPSCESETYELYLYEYDCEWDTAKELYTLYSGEDGNERLWVCWVEIYDQSQQYISYQIYQYESMCGNYTKTFELDKKTGVSKKVELFENKRLNVDGIVNNEIVYNQLQELVEQYNSKYSSEDREYLCPISFYDIEYNDASIKASFSIASDPSQNISLIYDTFVTSQRDEFIVK